MALPTSSGALHVEARAAEQLRVLVVARVEGVGSDVALVEGESLVGFLRTPTAVIHYHRDHRQVVLDRRGEFLGVEQETAVAVEVDHRAVGRGELRPQRGGEAESQPAQVQRGHQAARLEEVQPVLPEVGGQPRVQGNYGVLGHHLAKLGVDPLRLHRQGVQAFLAAQPLGAAGVPALHFLSPLRVDARLPLAQFLQQPLGHRSGVAFNADGDRVVAANFLRVNLNLDYPGVCGYEAVVVERRGLPQAGAYGQDDVSLSRGFDTLGSP